MRSPEQNPSNTALIERYLQYLRLERRYSENSVSAVKRDLALVSQAVDVVTSQDLKLLLAKRHANGAAPASLARAASSWRGFFSFLLKEKLIQANPALGLKTPKLARSLPKAVGVDQLLALLQGDLPLEFRFAQAHVLIELLYCTGLRISEALSLDEKVLSGTPELRVVGKGNKARIVPIIDNLSQRLTQFAAIRQAHLASTSIGGAPSLFVSGKGVNLSVRQAQKDVADYAKLKGLDQHLHPHMLRHSFGSHMLQGTQNLRAVQELLGHASIASTQVYTALDFDHLSSVYDKTFPRAR